MGERGNFAANRFLLAPVSIESSLLRPAAGKPKKKRTLAWPTATSFLNPGDRRDSSRQRPGDLSFPVSPGDFANGDAVADERNRSSIGRNPVSVGRECAGPLANWRDVAPPGRFFLFQLPPLTGDAFRTDSPDDRVIGNM